VRIQEEVFWIVTPCRVVVRYQRFKGPCCLHLQGEVKMGGRKSSEPMYSTTTLQCVATQKTSTLSVKGLMNLQRHCQCLESRDEKLVVEICQFLRHCELRQVANIQK
jgi:hypothetical protein